MNEDPLTVTLTQISQLVVTLNKKNVAQSSRQINQVKCAMKVTLMHTYTLVGHFAPHSLVAGLPPPQPVSQVYGCSGRPSPMIYSI